MSECVFNGFVCVRITIKARYDDDIDDDGGDKLFGSGNRTEAIHRL